ncbi:MAG TPA: hypothetical protein VM123_12220 [archaeon]|nr:hypothetical protein [archaeon]
MRLLRDYAFDRTTGRENRQGVLGRSPLGEAAEAGADHQEDREPARPRVTVAHWPKSRRPLELLDRHDASPLLAVARSGEGGATMVACP